MDFRGRSRFELSTEAALASGATKPRFRGSLLTAARGQEQQCVGHQLLSSVVRRSAGCVEWQQMR